MTYIARAKCLALFASLYICESDRGVRRLQMLEANSSSNYMLNLLFKGQSSPIEFDNYKHRTLSNCPLNGLSKNASPLLNISTSPFSLSHCSSYLHPIEGKQLIVSSSFIKCSPAYLRLPSSSPWVLELSPFKESEGNIVICIEIFPHQGTTVSENDVVIMA